MNAIDEDDEELDALNDEVDEENDGFYGRDQQGEIRWYAHVEAERCGGSGTLHCYCGGDFCACGNQGEVECPGCEDCDRNDEEIDYGDDD